MLTSHRILKITRLFHLYLGVFTAPALLFFAITGGLQTFSLHERTRGSDYSPPAWLAQLAQLHKKQTTVLPVRKPPASGADGTRDDTRNATSRERRPDAAAPAAVSATATPPDPGATATARAADGSAPKARNLLPMKIFFGIVAFGLLISTLSGLYMAYQYTRHKIRMTVILLAGVVVPMALLLL